MNSPSAAESPLQLGRIRYMNVAPIYWGMDQGPAPDRLIQIVDSPAGLNHRMIRNELDVSPVSAAAYAAHHRQWLLLPGLCISCFGPVMSVLLASRHPMEALGNARIRVSHDSASATALLKVLLANHAVTARLSPGPVIRADGIDPSDDAVLVIGDAALTGGWSDHFPYCYDLGHLWFEWTGLPFVFAVWAVSRQTARQQPAAVARLWRLLLASKTEGLSRLSAMAESAAADHGLPLTITRAYYNCLKYDLSPPAIAGLTRWCETMHHHGMVDSPVQLRFFDPPAGH